MKLADLALAKNVQYNDTLNPKLWDGDKLRKNVRQQLIKIGEKFFEELEVDPTALLDYYLVGSAANYNWSKYSDVDLHVLLDYDIVGQTCNDQLVEDFLFAKRAVWLGKYDLSVEGMQVEVGPQSKDAQLESKAVYSLLENNWVKKPVKSTPKIDEDRYDAKVEEMKKLIDSVCKPGTSSEEVEKVREKLKAMRKAGLAKGGEFNADNLVYKSLRNQGYLDKLEKLERAKVSDELST